MPMAANFIYIHVFLLLQLCYGLKLQNRDNELIQKVQMKQPPDQILIGSLVFQFGCYMIVQRVQILKSSLVKTF